jgi:hypothetical protein
MYKDFKYTLNWVLAHKVVLLLKKQNYVTEENHVHHKKIQVVTEMFVTNVKLRMFVASFHA